MSTLSKGAGYHHGDLRAACLTAALEMLEQADVEALSLRAIARHIGVTPSAPYRHFQDKDALLTALATQGYVDLAGRMGAADCLMAIAQAYVRYALDHPPLFRLMFAHPCGAAPETVAAADATHAALRRVVEQVVPDKERDAFMTGCWALVHGLAMLTLHGKLPSAAVDDQVTSTIIAILGEARAYTKVNI